MSWIKEKNWPNVALESDCAVVVQAIRSDVPMTFSFGLVVKDCRCLLAQMKHVSLIFINRSANEVAQSFARLSCSYPERQFSGGDVPANIMLCLIFYD